MPNWVTALCEKPIQRGNEMQSEDEQVTSITAEDVAAASGLEEEDEGPGLADGGEDFAKGVEEAFLRMNGEEPLEVEAEEEPAETDAEEAEVEEAEAEQESDDKAPSIEKQIKAARGSLKKAEQAAFDRADPVVQKAFGRRVHELTSQLHAHRQAYSAFEKKIEPLMPQIQASGQSIGTLMSHLVDAAMFADRDPVGYISQLVQIKGVDKRKLATALGLGNDDFFGDDDLEPEQQPTMQAPEQQVASARQIIEQFRTKLNPDGTLAHPFFDELRGEIAGLLSSGKANTIQDAYMLALHQRASAIRSQPSATGPQRADPTADAKRKLAKAQKANKVAPSAGSREPRKPDSEKTTEDILREAFGAVGIG